MFGIEFVDDGYVLLVNGHQVGPILDDSAVENLIAVLQARPQEWLDTDQALALCDLRGKPIGATGLRSALARGQIAGARKESITGLAKTEQGGQWRIPRGALLAWLERRTG